MAQEPVAGDRVVNSASSVIFRRLPYYLSPQFDIYENLGPFVIDKKVLEIGFGTGIGTLQYAHLAEWVYAIEIDGAAVRFAKRCFPIHNVEWLQADISQFSKKGYWNDFAVMIEVLEHISEPEKALDRIRVFLKSGGHALITVPNPDRERKKEDELIVQEWYPHEFHKLLSEYFDNVQFLDFELRKINGIPDTKATPLIALCS